MSNINEFKVVADHFMDDIKVTDALKEKTLKRCLEKPQRNFKFNAVPTVLAAALILVVCIYNSSIFNQTKNLKAPMMIEAQRKMNTFDANNNPSMKSAKNFSGMPQVGNTTQPSLKAAVQALTINDAKKAFKNIVLTPSYLPKGFKLQGIEGINDDKKDLKTIYLKFIASDRSFTLTIEKNGVWNDFTTYQEVTINNTKGHIKTFDTPGQITELKWFRDKFLYTLQGNITKKEAVKTAKSMN